MGLIAFHQFCADTEATASGRKLDAAYTMAEARSQCKLAQGQRGGLDFPAVVFALGLVGGQTSPQQQQLEHAPASNGRSSVRPLPPPAPHTAAAAQRAFEHFVDDRMTSIARTALLPGPQHFSSRQAALLRWLFDSYADEATGLLSE
eukprot:6477771-Prymnesium_polylepis.1